MNKATQTAAIDKTLAEICREFRLPAVASEAQWQRLLECLPVAVRRRFECYSLALSLSGDPFERRRLQEALAERTVPPGAAHMLEEALRLAAAPDLEARFYRFLGSDPQLVAVGLAGRMRLYRELLPSLVAAVTQSGSPPRRILDVGSFAGVVTVTIARVFPQAHVIGIERDVRWVEVARDLARRLAVGNVRFEPADCWAYNPECSVDQIWWLFVTSGQAPEDLLGAILSRARSWLRVGGRLILLERWQQDVDLLIRSAARVAGLAIGDVLPVRWHCPAEGDQLQRTNAYLLDRVS